MPEKRYIVGHWGYDSYGEAVNHCIKHNLCLESITMREYETPREYEERTGINYGCAPCDRLEDNSCKGAKPGAFYYPDECPMFYNAEAEQEAEDYEAWCEDTCYGLYEEEW